MAKTALNKKTIVGSTELARHLAGNRELIARLCQSGVIEVLPSGKYDLDDCRTRYIRHLRSRPPRGEGQAKLLEARANY